MGNKCLIEINGGMGKNVMATALMPELSEKYPEGVFVVSAYHDVFKSCSFVANSFPHGVPSIYESIKQDPDIDIIWRDPYNNSMFIRKQCHIFDAWRDELGLFKDKYGNYIDKRMNLDMLAEQDEMNPDRNNIVANINMLSSSYPELIDSVMEEVQKLGDHNFIMVQFTGGQSPLETDFTKPYRNANEGIKRNYYRGQIIIDTLRAKLPECPIVHYTLPNEPHYKGTINYEKPYLWYSELAKYAKAVITIDSSLLHLAAGAVKYNKDLKIISIWGETRPEHFGYTGPNFINLAATGVVDTQPYFRPMGSMATLINFPTPDKIVNSLLK